MIIVMNLGVKKVEIFQKIRKKNGRVRSSNRKGNLKGKYSVEINTKDIINNLKFINIENFNLNSIDDGKGNKNNIKNEKGVMVEKEKILFKIRYLGIYLLDMYLKKVNIPL